MGLVRNASISIPSTLLKVKDSTLANFFAASRS